MIKIGVLGATGRMGNMVAQLASKDKQFALVASVTHINHPQINHKIGNTLITHDTQEAFNLADVLIDFTNPNASMLHLSLAQEFKKPLFIGVTGGAMLEDKARNTSKIVPILLTANASIGVTIMNILAEKMAFLLDMDFDVEISETHHRYKKDAPSGTALSLGQSVARGRGQDFKDSYYIDHNQIRQRGKIGFSSQRGGEIIGDHTISFYGDCEILQLSHRSLSREIFAKGALKAALWLTHQPKGLYDMKDVIGKNS